MDIRTDVSLKPYLTMQLGGNAHTMVDLYTNDDIVAACTMARQQQAELFVLGGGSNTLAQDSGFAGIVARNRIPGFSVIAEDTESTTITIGAGEILDDVVARTVASGLSGIEALSAIPGTAGAAPGPYAPTFCTRAAPAVPGMSDNASLPLRPPATVLATTSSKTYPAPIVIVVD